MVEATRLGTLLEISKAIDITMYVRDSPLCKKSDVYSDVTRNIHIQAKIDEMERLGLIDLCQIPGSNATHLELTDKGVGVTDLLLEAESLLDESE